MEQTQTRQEEEEEEDAGEEKEKGNPSLNVFILHWNRDFGNLSTERCSRLLCSIENMLKRFCFTVSSGRNNIRVEEEGVVSCAVFDEKTAMNELLEKGSNLSSEIRRRGASFRFFVEGSLKKIRSENVAVTSLMFISPILQSLLNLTTEESDFVAEIETSIGDEIFGKYICAPVGYLTKFDGVLSECRFTLERIHDLEKVNAGYLDTGDRFLRTDATLTIAAIDECRRVLSIVIRDCFKAITELLESIRKTQMIIYEQTKIMQARYETSSQVEIVLQQKLNVMAL